jgi:hypothetical protein
MKIATAPVNWNNADAPDFREWFPYPQILDLMVAAGYTATEWGMNMPSHVSQMLTDLNERRLQLLGALLHWSSGMKPSWRTRLNGRSNSAIFSSRLVVSC